MDEYTRWLSSILGLIYPLLKPTATVYICADWLSSQSVFFAASEYFVVRNWITWERERALSAFVGALKLQADEPLVASTSDGRVLKRPPPPPISKRWPRSSQRMPAANFV